MRKNTRARTHDLKAESVSADRLPSRATARHPDDPVDGAAHLGLRPLLGLAARHLEEAGELDRVDRLHEPPQVRKIKVDLVLCD